ncbi:MAG TPA: alkaline phosphatase family protein [Terriglobales bacterium]|nr:alkaline phosphatase family protein [Terriglobales bacterium]
MLLRVGVTALLAAGFVGCADPPTRKIHHVVIIVQENRTPDNLFHGLPNADIANSGTNSLGQVVPLTPVSLTAPYDLDHAHHAFVSMYDAGKMDGADKIRCGGACPSNPQFRFVNPSEVTQYFQLAEQYTFGDRMFQSNQGPSFPAHQYLISGTSAPSVGSPYFAAENLGWTVSAGVGNFLTSGCTGVDQSVALIGPLGNESLQVTPCFEHLTLMDLLNPAYISWRYYTTGTSAANALWTAPDAIRHLRFGPSWNNVIPSPAQVLLDIANNQLPVVSWVIPRGQNSDHAGLNTGTGPSWVAAVVNAIGNSSYWSDTAVFITWDDWGGWYDHVAPPIHNIYEDGFRVPLIVVSPYAKAQYVSHKVHDFGSILRFIEENFRLRTLGYDDSRADNLSDCFDYNQVPLTFKTIAAPISAKQFLQDTSAPLDPDDD